MKNTLSFTAVICLFTIITLTGTSCKKNHTETSSKTYTSTGFSQLVVGEKFEIVVTKAATWSITAIGDQQDLNDLVMDTSVPKYLEITYRTSKNNRSKMMVYITMPSLTAFYLHGQATANISGFNNGPTLDGNVSSQAKCILDVNLPHIELYANAQAIIQVSGKAPQCHITTTGQSNIQAYSLETDQAITKAGGQSHIYIHAHTKLYAEASGQSTIHYRGTPNTNFIISGQAKIVKE